jgi:hypothetical protein
VVGTVIAVVTGRVRDALVRPMVVIEGLELAQRTKQVPLV